ncbi:MAG: hypothetical protein EOM12_15205, partial [Verrucomicrobiae bacterium]|nr:hypothetical protein [Verrucomicrobiae bacterium]
MKGCWYRISCLCIAFCFFLALPSVVYASKIDNMFEAIVGNAFLKAGKKIDNLAVLRKGDDFSSILRKNDDLVGLIKGRKLVDDDVLGLRKIGFPPGSRYVDEFMSLSKTERAIGYSLDDTVSKIARLQNGDDIVKKLGKKGLLSSGVYG